MFRVRNEQMAVLAKHFTARNLVARFAGQGLQARWVENTDEVLVKDPRGNVARLKLDDRGRVAQLTTPLGFRYGFDYDAGHRLAGVTAPGGLRTSAEYDEKGLLKSVSHGRDQRWLFGWDDWGNLSQVTLPDKTTLRTTCTGPKRPSEYVDGAGQAVRFERNEIGALVGIVEATGARTRYEYGPWDRPSRITRPDGTHEDVLRDAKGRLVSAGVNGQPWFKAAYDDGGRVREIRYADGHFVAFTYDGAGKVTEARNPDAVVKLEYDGEGRLVREEQGGQVVRYGYDAAGLLTTLTTPTGEELKFVYDEDARLVGVEDWDKRTHTIHYGNAGQTVRHSFPNGVSTETRFLDTKLPGEIRTTGPRLGPQPLSLRFTYTLNDQVRTLDDTEAGPRRFSYFYCARSFS
jgi:YD repeat-containing protein